MPQMSPLGWIWLVVFVSMGYILFLISFYFIFNSVLKFPIFFLSFKVMDWVW